MNWQAFVNVYMKRSICQNHAVLIAILTAANQTVAVAPMKNVTHAHPLPVLQITSVVQTAAQSARLVIQVAVIRAFRMESVILIFMTAASRIVAMSFCEPRS